MYNRYIPQADGSFRCSRIPEPAPSIPKPPPRKEPPAPPHPPEKESPPVSIRPQLSPRPHPPRPAPPPKRRPEPTGVPGFLRQLLPQNFDTEDLLIVLLLLLMSGECLEDQNTALLTLAIYLFL